MIPMLRLSTTLRTSAAAWIGRMIVLLYFFFFLRIVEHTRRSERHFLKFERSHMVIIDMELQYKMHLLVKFNRMAVLCLHEVM